MRTAKGGIFVSALCAGLIAVLALPACGDSSEPAGNGVANAPVPLPEPVRITEGDFAPPALAEEAQAKGEEAFDRYASAPVFDGAIAGFTIGPDASVEYPCPGDEARPTDAPQYPIDISYLPPNTFETYEPYVAVCPDGSLYSALRLFQIGESGADDSMFGGAHFNVMLIGSNRALHESFPQDLVEADPVRGREAAVLRPLTGEGFGESRVLVPLDGPEGYLQVLAYNLPFEEVEEIAEGLSCEGC